MSILVKNRHINKRRKDFLTGIFGLFLFSFLIVSCSLNPKKVRQTLDEAGNNRQELENVIEHYRISGEKEKLKAAWFLIGNMANKYSTVWVNRKQYDNLYRFIDSTKAGDKSAVERWDSLKKVYGVTTYIKPDAANIKASLLIENIDLAFYVWHNMPWGKYYNFDQFCEYILPYRVSDEPLENWRPFFYKEMKRGLDSLKNKNDVRVACKYINDWVNRHHRILALVEVPKMGALDAFYHPAGTCNHRFVILISMLRTFGIPCVLDYTPQFTNYPGGHSWVVLFDTTGNPVSFNGGDTIKYSKTNKMPMGVGDWGATKVYRNTFAYDMDFFESETYGTLFGSPCYDVSGQYDMKIGMVSFDLPENKNKHVYLCTFGKRRNIIPVAYSKNNSKHVSFNNVGLNSLYMPAIFAEGQFVPLQNPTYFDTTANKPVYTPIMDKRQKVLLTRKYTETRPMKIWGKFIIGARIEASNNYLFQNPVLLHKIDSIPNHFIDVQSTNQQKFKFVRYLASDTGPNHISELEFYSGSEKLKGKLSTSQSEVNNGKIKSIQAMFDGDMSTYHEVSRKTWVMIEFDKPYQITKLKYVQRNDMNFIEIGHQYELMFFDKGWQSLGLKTATDSHLEYNNVPKNSVLLLCDLTAGKEERIFNYENGKQVWW